MRETKLTAAEASILRSVLAQIVLRSRTGQLGILHGANRFVSTNLSLKKADRELLNGIADKVGIVGGINEIT